MSVGNIKISLFCVFLLMVSMPSLAQVDFMMIQNWAIPTLHNPAFAGTSEYVRVRGGASIRELGSHASPKNFMAVAEAPFKIATSRIGAGVVVNNASYGVFRNLLVGGQGNYQFQIKKSKLNVGIQIGYYHSTYQGDSISHNEKLSGGAFDMGIGVLYSHPKFYIGLSGLHLTSPKLRMTKNGENQSDPIYTDTKLPTYLYFEAGGNIEVKKSLFKLQPSVLLGSDFSNFDALFEMRSTYNQFLTFGVDYRLKNVAGIFAGINVKDFFIGYSWGYDFKASVKGNTGNHELIVGYQFKLDLEKKNTFRQRSIRIM